MVYAEFNVNENRIEFLNSAFGIETVLLNGNKISRKFSFSGTIHEIKMNSLDLTLESKYRQFDKSEALLELKENEVLLGNLTVLADKTQRIFWMFFGLAVGFGLLKFLIFIF